MSVNSKNVLYGYSADINNVYAAVGNYAYATFTNDNIACIDIGSLPTPTPTPTPTPPAPTPTPTPTPPAPTPTPTPTPTPPVPTPTPTPTPDPSLVYYEFYMLPPGSCSLQPSCADPVTCPECCPDPAPEGGCDYCGGPSYTATVNVVDVTVGSSVITEQSVQTTFYCSIYANHGGPVLAPYDYNHYQKVCVFSLYNGWPSVNPLDIGIEWTGAFNKTNPEEPYCCGTTVNFSANKTYGAMDLAITNWEGLLGGNGSLITPYKIII